MQLGTVAMMSSELIAVNLLFGEDVGGQYAAVVQLAFMLRIATISLASLAAPVIITDYARGDLEIVAKSTIRAMKLIGLAVALPAGFLSATASDTLTAWLGPGFSSWGGLLSLQASILVLSSPVVPLYSICLAARRMWWPGVAQTLCALLFVFFAWAGAGMLEGPLSLACLFLGIFVAKELAYMVPYAARCIGIHTWRFALPIAYSFVMFVVAYLCTKALGYVWPMRSMLALACTGFAVAVPYLAVVWLLATSEERTEVRFLIAHSPVRRWFAGSDVGSV
jgi:O-antigen/teichoic acid export membrane protein